uniref:CTCK domain-containing protein n=1 Tax=Branchiostoma floridae TaxID=7739 RepID=C3ZGH1_BRAFL|eukprot:XP_002592341.1 hypothetical protein BRAFLDRAFT_101227 [Branchiostoma floridae]
MLVLAAILLVGKAHGWNDGKDDPEAALKTVEQRGERLLALLLNKIKGRRDKTDDVSQVETRGYGDKRAYCSKRGDKDKALGWNIVRMCSMCWYVKYLPNNYSPTHIMEARCDQDTRCLSGYGQCKQRNGVITVHRKKGSGWEEHKMSVGVSCECAVQDLTALHHFIRD